jgi:hypothetical protein
MKLRRIKISLMTDDETITLHVTVIGGVPYPNDFTVFWRGL